MTLSIKSRRIPARSQALDVTLECSLNSSGHKGKTIMSGIIDADTHMAESESMWRLFDRDLYHRRPVMLAAPDDTLYRDFNVLWLIDGNIFPKAAGKGGFRIITPTASKREAGRTDISLGCREITDVEARLAD